MLSSREYAEKLERSRYKTKLTRTRAYCPRCRMAWAYPELIGNRCLTCGEQLITAKTKN